jgi:6-phosphogluconate dehydrogenase
LDLIASAVFMRYLSDLREEREQANKIFPYDEMPCKENTEDSIKDLKDALYVARIISYAQGFDLIQKAKEKYNWSLQPESIALIWRGGCIIRSVFLGKIAQAFEKNDKLTNLIFDPFFQQAIEQKQKGLRHIVAQAAMSGIPLPAFSAALSWFDSYRCVTLPINLLQAQRDYFGAHTYERTDRQRGQFFHTNWTGHGGTTTSSTYNA